MTDKYITPRERRADEDDDTARIQEAIDGAAGAAISYKPARQEPPWIILGFAAGWFAWMLLAGLMSLI